MLASFFCCCRKSQHCSADCSCYLLSKFYALGYAVLIGVPQCLDAIINYLHAALLQQAGNHLNRFTAPAITAKGSRFLILEFQPSYLFKNSGNGGQYSSVYSWEPTRIAFDLKTSVITSFLSERPTLNSFTVVSGFTAFMPDAIASAIRLVPFHMVS